jgi:hypothetical protein
MTQVSVFEVFRVMGMRGGAGRLPAIGEGLKRHFCWMPATVTAIVRVQRDGENWHTSFLRIALAAFARQMSLGMEDALSVVVSCLRVSQL